jgi:hypothetical protein
VRRRLDAGVAGVVVLAGVLQSCRVDLAEHRLPDRVLLIGYVGGPRR